jgi:outer membrane protein TolC
MKKNKFLPAVFLFVLIVQPLIPAMTQAEEKLTRVITLADAWVIARENNKDILKAREYRKQIEGRYVEERAAALPQFVITSSIYRNRDNSQRAYGTFFPPESQIKSASIGLSQVLFTFGQVGAAIRGAKLGMASADEQLRTFRQATLRDVSAAFYDVLLARELRQLATQNLEQKERHRGEVQKRLTLGVVTDYDVLAAEVAVQNARPELIRMENLVRTSREKLRFLLGLEDEEIDVRGNLGKDPGPSTSREEAVAQARRNRPEIADVGHKIRIAGELSR